MAVRGVWACKWEFWEAEGKALTGSCRTPLLLTLRGLRGRDSHGMPLLAPSAPCMESALTPSPMFAAGTRLCCADVA